MVSDFLDVSKSKQFRIEKRQKRRVKSDNGSYSSADSQTVNITVPLNGEGIDCLAGCGLLFDIVGVASGNSTSSFNDWAASAWMREIRFYAGNNQIGKAIRNYNGFCNMMFKLLTNNEWSSSYGVVEGAKATTDASGNDAETSRQYFHTFLAGILTSEDYLFLSRNDSFRIEIDMATASQVGIVDAGTFDSYTVSNIYFVYQKVRPTGATRAIVNQKLNSGLKYHYISYHSYLTTNISGDTNEKIGTLDGGLRSVFGFQVLDTARDGVDESYFNSYDRNNLSTYRFKLGEHDLSPEPIRLSATRLSENIQQIQDALMATPNMIGYSIGSESLNLETTGLVIAQRAMRDNNQDILSSLVDNSRNQLEVDLTYSSSPASHTLYIYSILDKETIIYMDKPIKNTGTQDLFKEMQTDLTNVA